jgi:hypothetical protein
MWWPADRDDFARRRGKKHYQDWLITSAGWAATKKRFRATPRGTEGCELRNASSCDGPLSVHHLTYERLGCERDEDLALLCDRHHKSLQLLAELHGWTPDRDAIVVHAAGGTPNDQLLAAYSEWLATPDGRCKTCLRTVGSDDQLIRGCADHD